jgi:hypothetical protein
VAAKEFAVTIQFYVDAPNSDVAEHIGEKIAAYIYHTDGIDSDTIKVLELD